MTQTDPKPKHNTTMSNQQSSASFSYSSSSYSSYSGSQSGPETRSQRYSEQHTYNDRDGHTYTRTTQQNGGPIYQETSIRPADRTLQGAHEPIQGRITDVSAEDEEQAKKDREYEEKMEDEYAKREGGA